MTVRVRAVFAHAAQVVGQLDGVPKHGEAEDRGDERGSREAADRVARRRERRLQRRVSDRDVTKQERHPPRTVAAGSPITTSGWKRWAGVETEISLSRACKSLRSRDGGGPGS